MLTWSTRSIGSISEQQGSIKIWYQNEFIQFPTRVDLSDVSWNLHSYCSPNLVEPLRAWRNQCYNWKTSHGGMPSQYRKNVYITLRDIASTPRTIIKLPGVWIDAFQMSALDYETEANIEITTNLKLSRIEYLDGQGVELG